MLDIKVDLGDRSYPIFIGSDLLGQKDLLKPFIGGQQVLVVSNDVVAPLYLDNLCAALPDIDVDLSLIHI